MKSKAFPMFSLNLKFSLEPKALPRDSMGLQNFPKFYKVVYMFLLGLKSFHMVSLQPKTVCRRLLKFLIVIKGLPQSFVESSDFPWVPTGSQNFYRFPLVLRDFSRFSLLPKSFPKVSLSLKTLRRFSLLP